MRGWGKLGAALLSLLPPHDERWYHICRQYVDRYNGDNDSNIATNGESRFLHRALARSQTVFDVGANVGEWSKLALTIKPTIELHCFEPSRASYSRLLANSFSANVKCNHCGLGAAVEDRTLYVFEDGSGLNSLYRRQGLEDGWRLESQTTTETVHIDTVDRYCAQNQIEAIDFMKTDVEGHELEVFRGAAGMLGRGAIAAIQFEYGGCNIDARVLLKDMFDFFGPLKYALYKIYPRELRYVARYDQRLENFQYQNWVAIREDAAATLAGVAPPDQPD